MKNKFFVFLIVLFSSSLLFLTSCEKESVNKDNPDIEELTPNQSRILNKSATFTSSDPDPALELKMIASIDAPNDNVSATSICFDGNNKSYVSWHEKGAAFQGYIDLLSFDENNNKLILKESYYSSEFDFNHIYKGKDAIYVAVDNFNHGAMIAEVLNEKYYFSIDVTPIPGSSANWIEQVGDELYVVSGGKNGVFCKYDIDTKEVTSEMKMPYAKSIFKMDNEYGILHNVLNGAKVYNTASGTNFSVGSISPEYGKNACYTYDSKVYVAKGGSGLGVYSMSGEELGSFTAPQGGDAVNCVYVDDKYVYLAYGGSGIYILNHDLEQVYSYKYNKDKASANFIRKDGDYIYVSYGLSGVQVLELVELN